MIAVADAHSSGMAPDFGRQKQKTQSHHRQSRMFHLGCCPCPPSEDRNSARLALKAIMFRQNGFLDSTIRREESKRFRSKNTPISHFLSAEGSWLAEHKLGAFQRDPVMSNLAHDPIPGTRDCHVCRLECSVISGRESPVGRKASDRRVCEVAGDQGAPVVQFLLGGPVSLGFFTCQ